MLFLAWLVTGTVLTYVLMVDVILVAVLMGMWFGISHFVWSGLRKTNRYLPSKRRVKWTLFFCVLGFLFAVAAANRCCLGHKSHPLSLLADGVLMVCTVFAGWASLAPGKRKFSIVLVMAAGSTVVLGIGWLQKTGDEPQRQGDSFKALTSLPYIAWAPVGDTKGKSGVTYHDEARAFDGINLYKSRNESAAHLMDMAGGILHTWSAPPGEKEDWFHIEVLGNGDLLVVVKDGAVIGLDWDSNVKWKKKTRSHHDVAFAENGDTYVLTKEDEILVSRGLPIPVLSDYILVFAADDELRQKISLFRAFEAEIPLGLKDVIGFYLYLLSPSTQLRAIRSVFGDQLIFLQGNSVDVMHTNSLEIIDREIDDIFSTGNILCCSRTLDLIGVLDPQTSTLLWSWGKGVLDRPHHPTLLDNGNILVFDNGWSRRHFSRVLEINPKTEEIVWEYRAGSPEEFYSPKMGASQRLPNGNTLITNSYSGQVFEVNDKGKKVWEFYNPVVEKERRAVIYRMERIYDRDKYPFLDSVRSRDTGG